MGGTGNSGKAILTHAAIDDIVYFVIGCAHHEHSRSFADS
jgi:hypothetical protein